jgi:hypothetical protein
MWWRIGIANCCRELWCCLLLQSSRRSGKFKLTAKKWAAMGVVQISGRKGFGDNQSACKTRFALSLVMLRFQRIKQEV